jgi:hypothetical protein
VTENSSMSGRIRTQGLGFSIGIPRTSFGVGFGIGEVFDGGRSHGIYLNFQGDRSLSLLPVDISWERVTYAPDVKLDDVAGGGLQITASAGVLTGFVFNDKGQRVGELWGLKSNISAGASGGYSWVLTAPIEKPGQHIETQVVESGAGGYRTITTLTEFAERNRTNPRIIVTERRFEIRESEHGPYDVLVEEKVLSNRSNDRRAPGYRAGSGNLNNWDKWIFCLRAA